MKLNWCGIYIPNKTSGLFQKLFLGDVVDVGIIGAEFFFFLVYFTFLIGFGEEMWLMFIGLH